MIELAAYQIRDKNSRCLLSKRQGAVAVVLFASPTAFLVEISMGCAVVPTSSSLQKPTSATLTSVMLPPIHLPSTHNHSLTQ